jgi:hypothetical protein
MNDPAGCDKFRLLKQEYESALGEEHSTNTGVGLPFDNRFGTKVGR